MSYKTPTILCVDDEPLNQTLLEAVLGAHGYETLAADDGQKALDLLATVATSPPTMRGC